GTRMMLAVGLSEVTTTHTTGRSHSTARAPSAAASSRPWASRSRDTAASELRVAAQEAELQQREHQDDGEEHPRHRGGGAEREEVLEGGLVEVLDDGAGAVARAALREHEDLPEDLERADDVGDEDEEEHGAEQGQRDGPEAPDRAGPVERRRLVEVAGNVLEAGQVDHEVVPRHPPHGGRDDYPHRGAALGGPLEPPPDQPAEVVVERPDHGIEQPEPGEPDRDHGEGEREEEGAA